MKAYKLTCVANDGTVGTMILQAETTTEVLKEIKTYPAVKYVLGIEEISEDELETN